MYIPVIYLIVSVISFVAYAMDKRAARKEKQRIPEKTLHIFDLLGGWPGGMLAMKLVRHKTQKRSFLIVFWITVVIHLVSWGVYLGWYLRGQAITNIAS